MKKKLIIILLCAALLVLSACGQSSPSEEEHLVWLYKESQGDGYFYGQDSDGKLWLVHGEYDADWACSWVRYTGEPQQCEDADYEITADSAWHNVECEQVFFGEAFDTCLYDHDNDGTQELCVLSRFENSEPGQYELTVWDGNTCEADTFFYGSGSVEALAFDWEEDQMVIRSVNWPYGDESWTIETYNVRWQEGGPAVSKTAS